jgi:hypothetical protein
MSNGTIFNFLHVCLYTTPTNTLCIAADSSSSESMSGKPFIMCMTTMIMVILTINSVMVEAAAVSSSMVSLSLSTNDSNPLIYTHNGLPRKEVYYLDDLVSVTIHKFIHNIML